MKNTLLNPTEEQSRNPFISPLVFRYHVIEDRDVSTPYYSYLFPDFNLEIHICREKGEIFIDRECNIQALLEMFKKLKGKEGSLEDIFSGFQGEEMYNGFSGDVFHKYYERVPLSESSRLLRFVLNKRYLRDIVLENIGRRILPDIPFSWKISDKEKAEFDDLRSKYDFFSSN